MKYESDAELSSGHLAQIRKLDMGEVLETIRTSETPCDHFSGDT